MHRGGILEQRSSRGLTLDGCVQLLGDRFKGTKVQLVVVIRHSNGQWTLKVNLK